MLIYNVIMTSRARYDLIDIGDYITYTLLESKAALDLIKGIRKEIIGLSKLPNRQALVGDVVLASQGIRCLLYKNYYIFYEVDETSKTVFVVRIGYNRRSWKEILNPSK